MRRQVGVVGGRTAACTAMRRGRHGRLPTTRPFAANRLIATATPMTSPAAPSGPHLGLDSAGA